MPGHEQYTVNTYRGHGGQGPHCRCFNLMLIPLDGRLGGSYSQSANGKEKHPWPCQKSNPIHLVCSQSVYWLSYHSAKKPLNTYNKHVQWVCTCKSDTHSHFLKTN